LGTSDPIVSTKYDEDENASWQEKMFTN